MRRRAGAFAAAVLLAGAAPLGAHDFWLEPSAFDAAPGSVVSVSLRVGQRFVGDAVPRSGDVIEDFYIRQDGRQEDVGGVEGRDPAGFVLAGRGTGVVAYRSRPAFIEMPAARFELYLREEGLDHVIAARRARGQSGRPGREYFSRYAKSIIRGERGSHAATRPTGLDFELIPVHDPTVVGGPFRGSLLYRGRGIAGIRVVAISRGNSSATLATLTDARGDFSLPLPDGGTWLIKAVHMVEAGWFSRADWHSLWASLTFEAPARRGQTGSDSQPVPLTATPQPWYRPRVVVPASAALAMVALVLAFGRTHAS